MPLVKLKGRKYTTFGHNAGLREVVLYASNEPTEILIENGDRKVWVNAKELLDALKELKVLT